MGEHHHDHGKLKGRNLFISVILNLGITIAQIIGGILSGSMALLSDALHNFSDVLSLMITYVTYKLAAKKHTPKHTFGYQRGEILAAFVNSVTLFIIAAFSGAKRWKTFHTCSNYLYRFYPGHCCFNDNRDLV